MTTQKLESPFVTLDEIWMEAVSQHFPDSIPHVFSRAGFGPNFEIDLSEGHRPDVVDRKLVSLYGKVTPQDIMRLEYAGEFMNDHLSDLEEKLGKRAAKKAGFAQLRQDVVPLSANYVSLLTQAALEGSPQSIADRNENYEQCVFELPETLSGEPVNERDLLRKINTLARSQFLKALAIHVTDSFQAVPLDQAVNDPDMSITAVIILSKNVDNLFMATITCGKIFLNSGGIERASDRLLRQLMDHPGPAAANTYSRFQAEVAHCRSFCARITREIFKPQDNDNIWHYFTMTSRKRFEAVRSDVYDKELTRENFLEEADKTFMGFNWSIDEDAEVPLHPVGMQDTSESRVKTSIGRFLANDLGSLGIQSADLGCVSRKKVEKLFIETASDLSDYDKYEAMLMDLAELVVRDTGEVKRMKEREAKAGAKETRRRQREQRGDFSEEDDDEDDDDEKEFTGLISWDRTDYGLEITPQEARDKIMSAPNPLHTLKWISRNLRRETMFVWLADQFKKPYLAKQTNEFDCIVKACTNPLNSSTQTEWNSLDARAIAWFYVGDTKDDGKSIFQCVPKSELVNLANGPKVFPWIENRSASLLDENGNRVDRNMLDDDAFGQFFDVAGAPLESDWITAMGRRGMPNTRSRPLHKLPLADRQVYITNARAAFSNIRGKMAVFRLRHVDWDAETGEPIPVRLGNEHGSFGVSEQHGQGRSETFRYRVTSVPLESLMARGAEACEVDEDAAREQKELEQRQKAAAKVQALELAKSFIGSRVWWQLDAMFRDGNNEELKDRAQKLRDDRIKILAEADPAKFFRAQKDKGPDRDELIKNVVSHIQFEEAQIEQWFKNQSQ